MIEKVERRPYTVHGKIKFFSQKEIEEILEKYMPKYMPKRNFFEIAEKPTDGKCFKVELGKINFSLFLKERNDREQECTRKLILEAFIEALKKPEKYKVLYLLIPKKEWVYGDKEEITVAEQINFAENVGERLNTWVEEALGWAQQISNDNGSDEAWETVCNKPDTLKYTRLLLWKNGEIRIIGGSNQCVNDPATNVSQGYYSYNFILRSTVPSVLL